MDPPLLEGIFTWCKEGERPAAFGIDISILYGIANFLKSFFF